MNVIFTPFVASPLAADRKSSNAMAQWIVCGKMPYLRIVGSV
jgi:hypothetical protein